MMSRPGQFPSVLPVVRTEADVKPPMRFSPDNSIALPIGDENTHFKEFYAIPEVIADGRARLKKARSKLELRVVPGNTVTRGGMTLLMWHRTSSARRRRTARNRRRPSSVVHTERRSCGC